MKRLLLIAVLLLPLALQAQQVEPTWESLNRRGYPQWFSDAKLGIFIHWGLYSVPAYAGKEGYGEWLYKGLLARDPGRMRAMSYYADTTLPVREMYGQLTRHWHAELWQPQDWARMFREAGAQYVMLVTKHHDGYSLWDDPYEPEWNSVVSGPKRNIVEELTEAVRKEGLRMCFYYSLPEWSNPLHRWTVDPDTAIGDYVANYMIPQFKSLVSKYQPDAVFADGDWDFSSEQLHSTELIAWYYNTVGDKAIVNDRWGKGTQHGFKTPEYSAGISVTDRPWAECRGIGRSFGLNRNEDLENYLTATELIQHFCELVASGGGLTLNVGPYADGTIPLIQQERLQALGRWLQVNGEAIYGSRPYKTPEGVLSPCQRTRTVAELPHRTHIDYDWVRNAPLKGMPVDNFEIRWEGVTGPTPPKAGDYIIRIEGDDEVWLTGSVDTLYYNHAWAENNNTATVHLDGNHVLALYVRYREKDLEAAVHVDWSRDGGRTFTPVYADWHGTASWERTLRCFTTKGGNLYVIEFERPGQTVVIPNMPRLQKGAAVTLLGTTGTTKWKQKKDGTLKLDLSGLNQKELNALDHAWVFKIK
ncbi:MAG: alpha-L-fucosidase [Bacteroidales bacterium]|nr:alpha-L-fucosidase [Bacteroidales bacterium]